MLVTSTASLAGFDDDDVGAVTNDTLRPGAIFNAFDRALQQKYAGKASRAIAAVNAKKKPKPMAAAPAPASDAAPVKSAWYRTPYALGVGVGALALLVLVVVLVRGRKA